MGLNSPGATAVVWLPLPLVRTPQIFRLCSSSLCLSNANLNESDTLLTCLAHIILRHNVYPRIGDNKVQSRETGSPRLDKSDFEPFARFLRIPVVDKLLQTLLSSLCPGYAEIIPEKSCQHAE